MSNLKQRADSTDEDGLSSGRDYDEQALELDARKTRLTSSAIPVTILSGFLGSGKTTLLKHVLESSEHNLKVAVIVNDMAELNIDGDVVRQVKKEVITLQNGCICCTLRGDLIREINRIQATGSYDYVLIESTGIAEPQQVAESFCADPGTQALTKDPDKMLWRVARLDTCVTVIDALNFPHHMASLKRFREVFKDELDEIDSEEGEKSIAHLLIEQEEFANVILLNKKDLVSEADLDSIQQVLQSLNPNAKIISTQFGVVDPRIILNTQLFRMEEAAMSPGWLVSMGLGSSSPMQLVSESEEYGISSFVYRSRKPFHPSRLQNWINQVFVLTDDWNDKKKMSAHEDPNDRLKRTASLYGQILRSKGFCWIAGRDSYMGAWAQSGQLLAIHPMIPWYVTRPESEWDVEAEEELTLIKGKFEGEHGDRRQELVFIGINLQKDRIAESLNDCLLKDEEMLLHSNFQDGHYFDPLPPWTIHYSEPGIFAAMIRPGQTCKFKVEDGVAVKLSNVALNIAGVVDESAIRVKVWLDSFTENDVRKSSVLIATLRAHRCEQHAFDITLPGNPGEENSGPMVVRLDNDDGDVSNWNMIEVHVSGYVFYQETTEHNVQDDDAKEDEDGDQHDNQCGHSHVPFKRQKTATNP